MELRNKYWVLRHGRSNPNEKGLIVSHLSNGILPEHGLAPAGFEQARAAGNCFLKELEAESISIDDVRVYCSPFSRTKDTAKNVAEVLGLDDSKLQFCEELRERYFGTSLELQSHEHYPEIWALDQKDPLTGPVNGESVADVVTRLEKVIQKIELECQGFMLIPLDTCSFFSRAILIVSHGDPLQIFQTIILLAPYKHENGRDGTEGEQRFNASVLSQHRKFGLETGELRRIF